MVFENIMSVKFIYLFFHLFTTGHSDCPAGPVRVQHQVVFRRVRHDMSPALGGRREISENLFLDPGGRLGAEVSAGGMSGP